VTARAHEVARALPSGVPEEESGFHPASLSQNSGRPNVSLLWGGAVAATFSHPLKLRSILLASLVPGASSSSDKVISRSLTTVQHGDGQLDLAGLEQLVSTSQTRAIADTLGFLANNRGPAGLAGDAPTLRETIDALEREWDEKSVDVLAGDRRDGMLARPRGIEVGMAINRLVSERQDRPMWLLFSFLWCQRTMRARQM
jgi:hypothetical protein